LRELFGGRPVSGGGICSAGSFDSIRRSSSLESGWPRFTTPGWSGVPIADSSSSSRRSALRWFWSGPWH
jgi:hypothetical protein